MTYIDLEKRDSYYNPVENEVIETWTVSTMAMRKNIIVNYYIVFHKNYIQIRVNYFNIDKGIVKHWFKRVNKKIKRK